MTNQTTERLAERLLRQADAVASQVVTGHDWPNTQEELELLNAAGLMRAAAAAIAKQQAAEPCIVCNALIVQRNAAHHEADDLAAAQVRGRLVAASLNAEQQASQDTQERAPYITDEQVTEWADGFIQQKAFNRPVAIQIAIRAAQWVRDQYEPSLNGLSDALRAEIEPPTFMGEPVATTPSAPQADHFPDSGKLVREQAAGAVPVEPPDEHPNNRYLFKYMCARMGVELGSDNVAGALKKVNAAIAHQVREQAALTPTGPCEGCDLPNGCPEYCHCGEPPAFIAQGTTPAAGVGDARKLTADQERHVFLAAHGDMRDQPRLTSQDAAWIGWQSRGALAKGIAFVLPEEFDGCITQEKT